jgi:hypothetical protein
LGIELPTGEGVRNSVEPRHPQPWLGYGRAMQFISLLLGAFLLLFPTTGEGQSLRPTDAKSKKGSEKDAPIPKEYLPPPGMCRIWVDNVPANRQPAPTDCATAIRNRPPNARVIFPAAKTGDQKAAPGRGRPDTTKRKPPN